MRAGVYTVWQEAQSPIGSWQQSGVLHEVVQRNRTPEVLRRWNHWDLEMRVRLMETQGVRLMETSE